MNPSALALNRYACAYYPTDPGGVGLWLAYAAVSGLNVTVKSDSTFRDCLTLMQASNDNEAFEPDLESILFVSSESCVLPRIFSPVPSTQCPRHRAY